MMVNQLTRDGNVQKKWATSPAAARKSVPQWSEWK